MKRSIEKPNNIKLINKAKTEYFRGEKARKSQQIYLPEKIVEIFEEKR